MVNDKNIVSPYEKQLIISKKLNQKESMPGSVYLQGRMSKYMKVQQGKSSLSYAIKAYGREPTKELSSLFQQITQGQVMAFANQSRDINRLMADQSIED